MRILHTADWHLGKRLHRHALHGFQVQFIEWLLKTVEEQAVEAILVAGDIFDTANPSSEARNLYYTALARLHGLGCQVIITGGNHDSPAVLQAPKTLLEALRIHVVGEKTEAPEAMLVPLQDRAGHTHALVSAVPFLRDADLRRLVEGETALQREEAVREGIARVFREQAEAAAREAGGVPCIAMGHLFVHGVSTSDSEREIQVGNLAGVTDQVFPETFDYVALGHIHKPQKVGQEDRIFYAGSPVPLSFSESQDHKRVILLEVSDEGIQHESLSVPVFCRLPRFKGPLEHIRQKLETLDPGQDALIEVHLMAERDHPDIPVQLNELVAEHNRQHPDQLIIQQRIEYGDRTVGAGQLFEQEQNLDALSPEAVFRERLDRDQPEPETRALLEDAFQEILEEIRQSENS